MGIERPRGTEPRRPTGWDVAQLSGLSRSTVSQILNGNHLRFTPETRDRVTEAAAALNYRPSRAGRALVTGRSDLIVLAAPNITFGRHLQDAVDQIARTSAADGMSVVVRYAGNDPAATLTTVLDLRPAAVIDLGVFDESALAAIRATGTRILPSVLSGVGDPNRDMGRMQAEEVLRVPTRRLVYAMRSDERDDSFGARRADGVADAARAADVPEPSLVRVPLHLDGAREVLEPILRDARRSPIGVCCYNDEVAIAVLAVARELELRVPEDVAVVGADYTDVGQLIVPRLTTIRIEFAGLIGAGLAHVDWRGERVGEDDAADDGLLPIQQVDPAEFLILVRGESS